jgi:reductive dehalogenase
MRKLTLEEWEDRYIKGTIDRFDQKNIMFARWSWDPTQRPLIKDWRFLGEVTDKPGYELRDLALRRASRVGTMVMPHDMSKPNPSRINRAMSKAMKEAVKEAMLPGQTPSLDAADLDPPDWAKKAYVSDPETVARDIKKVAQYVGADLVGICKLDKRWVYSHSYDGEGPSGALGNTPVVEGDHKQQEIPDECQYAVVMGFGEDYNMMKYYPSWIAHTDTSMGYSRMAISNMYLSAFIRSMGYRAIDCSTNDVARTIPMAMQAGLGDIGRNGLLITPEFGPRLRISKVITDLPLVSDTPIEFGVTEMCEVCKKCADLCPSQSIMHEARTTEPRNISNSGGVLKWPVNAETCRAYWGKMNRPCTTCISSCPYNKPYNWFHRSVQWFTDHARWGDWLYAKMDDWLGYGKPEDPENFWEEWKPLTRKPY